MTGICKSTCTNKRAGAGSLTKSISKQYTGYYLYDPAPQHWLRKKLRSHTQVPQKCYPPLMGGITAISSLTEAGGADLQARHILDEQQISPDF